MEKRKSNPAIRIIASLCFLLMLVVNLLAAGLPINGVTPAEISDKYANFFAPAGLTFSIWGLIYILLGAYTLYQLGLFRNGRNPDARLLDRISEYFALSSVINVAWIFAWHYDRIPVSMLLMILLLLTLIKIVTIVVKEDLSAKEKLFIKLPFSIYFGWITVATIANLTVLLVSMDWGGWGLPDETWAILVIIAGLLIGISTMQKNRDVAYGLVIIWAYLGIIVKHLSAQGFAGQYPWIIIVCAICIAVLIIDAGYILYKGKRRSCKC